MDLESRFADVFFVMGGANSNVYEINPLVVVKVPKAADDQRELFRHEVEILDILSHHPPCPYVITCFLHSNDGIFFEYMRDICLSFRIQQNHHRDPATRRVTRVGRLEALSLRKTWMDELSHGVAFLESLDLAHGDLRPENILLDRDRLKISDFDCAAKIGSEVDVCQEPYGRLLRDENGGKGDTAGSMGPRTEQFALGSLYYFINYGFEVYGDQTLGTDPSGKEHYVALRDILQAMIFPKLDGEPATDSIIQKCWHNRYETIAALAVDTEKLCSGGRQIPDDETSGATLPEQMDVKSFCKDFAKSGALQAIASWDPEQITVPMRHRYAQNPVRDP